MQRDRAGRGRRHGTGAGGACALLWALQAAQPGLGPARQGRAARPEPGQRVGPGLRAADPRMGGRQRHRRVHSVLRGSREHSGAKARPDGLDPRRGADRHGLTTPPTDSSSTPARARGRRCSCSPPRRGRSPAGTRTCRRRRRRPRRSPRSNVPGRDLQGPGDRQHGGRPRSTPPTSTTARLTSATRTSHRCTSAGPSDDPAIPNAASPRSASRPSTATIFVTYAKQDADAEDDVAGRGNGFVDVFDTDGICCAASHGADGSTRRGASRWPRRASAARAARC